MYCDESISRGSWGRRGINQRPFGRIPTSELRSVIGTCCGGGGGLGVYVGFLACRYSESFLSSGLLRRSCCLVIDEMFLAFVRELLRIWINSSFPFRCRTSRNDCF